MTILSARTVGVVAAVLLGVVAQIPDSAAFASQASPSTPPSAQSSLPPAVAGQPRPGVPPPRDRASVPTGTARVRGRVTAAETGAGLRRALVTIQTQEPGVRRSTTTDADGRYEFAELPAGRYTINANKAGFVTLQYGQRRPTEPGTPVQIADGGSTGGLDLALPRGSVITGRLTDEFGEPIAGAQVQAQRYGYQADGQRRLFPSGFTTSDDLGNFRVYGLMPGEYVIRAEARSAMMMMTTGPAVGSDMTEGFAATYYPGTPSASEAQAVTVGLGQEASAPFSMNAIRLARVTGTVIDSSGRPVAGAALMLRSSDVSSGVFFTSGGQTMADGSFVLGAVPPGEHMIEVRPSPRSGEQAEFGRADVSVAGASVSGVRIVTGRPTTITGRVTFEGQAPRTGGTIPLRVMLQPSDPNRFQQVFMLGDAANGTVADDGQFQLSTVPGTAFLRVTPLPGWTLKSVTLDGTDVTDTPIDVATDGATDLRVVLTDRLTNISGTVTDGRGQASRDYTVVVVPAQLREGASPQRFLRAIRPDQDGSFRATGLPPGRYMALAVQSLEAGRQFVPEVQAKVRASGRPFTLDEGGSAVVDLRLASGEL